MSGEVVSLGDRDGELSKLIHAIAGLERREMPQHALIGGLAVIVRLAQQHRVTTDIDEVYMENETDMVQILLDHGARRQPNGVILGDGAKVDLIAVGDYDPEDLPDDAGQRAFVLAHRWALDTRTSVRLVVTNSAGAVLVETVTPVASVAALVTTKLASAPSRREPTLYKQASDIFDVYRLLTAHDVGGAVAAAILGAPQDLSILVRNLADQLLVREAERSVRWLLAFGSPEMANVTADDLRFVGEPFRDHLKSATE